MDDIKTSLILEKNELMYLIDCLNQEGSNSNAATLAEYTGISDIDSRSAVTGLMQKNIISVADNRLVTVKLFDFYIRKLLSAESVEATDGERKMLIFNNPGFILLVKEHALSQNHITIQAFQSKEEIQ